MNNIKKYKISIITIIISIILILFIHNNAQANYFNAQTSWQQWVKDLRIEALADGIDPGLFDYVFSTIPRPDRKTLRLDRSQPEKRLTFTKYRSTRGDAYRIKLGQQKYKKFQNMLEQIGHEYAVDPCFITALWGIESSYGHFLGSFPVIKSLATLAYNPRRSKFFRKELLFALRILNEGHIDFKDFKGEWAGASGQPQFLPSSWYKYAVDYDGDGRKDIWKTYSDAFASIANYLKQNGWREHEPWAMEVNVPSNFDPELLDKNNFKSIAAWQQLGVQSSTKQALPDANLQAAIIKPYGGPYLMIFKNFRVIMRYNNSIYYAGTVGHIADKICKR